jgi:hypothetical protein
LIDGSMLKESVLGSLENDGNLMLEKSFLRDIRKVKENKSKDL